MSKIGVIINPHAKAVRKKRGYIGNYEKLESEFITIKITETLEQIDDVLRGFKKDNISYIGIVGGDGSIHNILTKTINIYSPERTPDIVILKGGTMNNIARTLKLRGKGTDILKRLEKRIKEGKGVELMELDTMKINEAYCQIFGAGMITNFLKEVYKGEKGWISNIKTIVKTLEQALFKGSNSEMFQGFDAKIIIDGKPLEFTNITALLGGTVESVSYGVKPMARANEEKLKFNMVILGISHLKMISKLPKILRGKPINHPLARNLMLTSMKIQSENGFDYTMDGDMFHAEKELLIEIGERLRFVMV